MLIICISFVKAEIFLASICLMFLTFQPQYVHCRYAYKYKKVYTRDDNELSNMACYM